MNKIGKKKNRAKMLKKAKNIKNNNIPKSLSANRRIAYKNIKGFNK